MIKDANDLVSSIVEGSVLEGSVLTVPSSLKVSGRVFCNIDCEGRLIIDSGGCVEGSVKAHSLVVHGTLKGSVWVKEQVRLSKGAVVHGYLSSERIEVEDGAVCHFKLSVEPGAADRHQKADVRSVNRDSALLPPEAKRTGPSGKTGSRSVGTTPYRNGSSSPAASDPTAGGTRSNRLTRNVSPAPAEPAAEDAINAEDVTKKTHTPGRPAPAGHTAPDGTRPAQNVPDREETVIERFW